MSTFNRAALVVAAREAAGNGDTVFGFIGSTEKGLRHDEFVVVPHGSVRRNFGLADKKRAGFAIGFQNSYIDCLYSDAERIAGLVEDEAMLPYVAANRAYAFAHGWLTDETVVSAVPLTDDERDRILKVCPHLAIACTVKANTGTLASFVTTACYWCTEHNTSGSTLPKGHYNAMVTATGVVDKTPNRQITSATYLAGHASDKRLTLRSMLPPSAVRHLRQPKVYCPVITAGLDKWAALRTEGDFLPAGTAIIGILKVYLHEVGKCGLLGFSPGPAATLALTAAYTSVASNPCAYHGGSKYLFDIDPISIVGVEDLKHYVGLFGGFCQAAGLCPSATAPKHIQELIGAHQEPAWVNAGKLFASGAEIDNTKVAAAAATVGATVGTDAPDPTDDAEGYKAYAATLMAAVKAATITAAPAPAP
jgi:hypothetical protein